MRSGYLEIERLTKQGGGNFAIEISMRMRVNPFPKLYININKQEETYNFNNKIE